MVQSKIDPRFPSINKEVILTQTDTTVGFLSHNSEKLSYIKSIDKTKKFITTFSNLKNFNNSSFRVPRKQKIFFRRMKKTTFIIKNTALRISPTPLKSQVLRNLQWTYSTSANESTKRFSRSFCEGKADIIIENKDGLHENSSSSLIKINNFKRVKLR